MSGWLERLNTAERMLAECVTATDAANAYDFAEAMRVWTKAAHLGTQATNRATHVKLKADRRLADLIDEGQANGEMAGHGQRKDITGRNVLSDQGLTAKQVHDARLIRDHFTEMEIAERVDTAKQEISRSRLLREARDRRAQKERDQQAAEDAQRIADTPTTCDLRLGDFREVLADLDGVDAIITDPPYPAEYLPLLSDLAAFADKTLKPDGILAMLMGQTYLPDVYRLLDGHRPYRWTACYLTNGAGYASHARRVHSNWKPLLIYGGGRRFADVIRSEATTSAKTLHKWGQDYPAFGTIIERLTRPGDVVCDPFAGSGTTLLAAINQHRNAVGAENDPTAHATALRRLR